MKISLNDLNYGKKIKLLVFVFLHTAVIVTTIFVSLTLLLQQNTTNYQDIA